MSATTKAITVRLPIRLYEAAADVATRRRKSINTVVQEGLETIIRDEEFARLYEAFGEVGEDAEGCDVEFALDAQREVIASGTS